MNQQKYAVLRKAKLIADILAAMAAAAEIDRTTVIKEIAKGGETEKAFDLAFSLAEKAQQQRDAERAGAPQEAASPAAFNAAWREKYSAGK